MRRAIPLHVNGNLTGNHPINGSVIGIELHMRLLGHKHIKNLLGFSRILGAFVDAGIVGRSVPDIGHFVEHGDLALQLIAGLENRLPAFLKLAARHH